MRSKYMNRKARFERDVRAFEEKAKKKLEEETLRNRTNPPVQPKRV